MSWIDRARNLLGRSDLNRDIDEELQFHIDEKTRDNIAAGMSADEARRDALRRFGSRSAIREETRDADVLSRVETVGRDITFGLRHLRRQPAFACAAILTLALGIGATTAIFTVVYSVLLRPLPYPDPDRLMVVSYQTREPGFWLFPGVVDGHYLALRDADRSFESTATFGSEQTTLTGAGDPVRLAGASVTPDFFGVLRINAALGRVFQPADAAEGTDRVVAISDTLWRTRFGADPGIVGRRITLDAVPHTVVGVLPAGFAFPAKAALWTPLAVRISPRNSYTRPVIARLKPGTTRAQAQSAWEALTSNLQPQRGATGNWVAQVVPLKDAVVGNVRTPLLIFAGAVALVLIIACANVSNLLIMRTLARRQEIAARLALGASRGRVLRQLLTETAVMALLGALLGTLVTVVGVPALLSLTPDGLLPRDSEIQIDGWVLIFTFGIALVSGLTLGLAPAMHGTRDAAVVPGRESTTWSTRRSDWLRGTLVVGQVAMALVLLVGAGLLVKSFLRLTAVEMGFQPSQVMTMTVSFPPSTYPTAPLLQRAHQRLLESVEALPDIVAAGAVNWLPLGDMLITGDVLLRDARPIPDNYRVTKAAISPGYLSAMGIRVLRGRNFTGADTAGSPGVALVTDSMAQRLWPGEEAVGQMVSLEDRPTAADWLTVVGVVGDVRQTGIRDDLAPAVYQPYLQVKRPFFLGQMTFVARTTGNPGPIAAAMRTALGSVDANLAPQSMRSMESVLAGTIAEPRFQTRLLVVFSVLALVLAVIGVYGVLAASVAERRREIGIRIALGAGRTTLVWTVLRRVLIMTVCGVTLGLAGAFAITRVLAKMLFEITPTDATAFFGAGTLLVAAALAASLVPARRASSIDPISVLRAE
jgi:predicted permease